LILFLFILSGLFGQTKPEYRWLIGTWAGTSSGDGYSENITLTFNDNGSGRSHGIYTHGRQRNEETIDFIFSIISYPVERIIIFHLNVSSNENEKNYFIISVLYSCTEPLCSTAFTTCIFTTE